MKSADVSPKSIGLIDVLVDAIFRFIVDSQLALDRRGKMLNEIFRRAAPQYGVNRNGKTLPELNARLTVIKKLQRKLTMSNPEITQKRNSTRQQNKMIAATQAAIWPLPNKRNVTQSGSRNNIPSACNAIPNQPQH